MIVVAPADAVPALRNLALTENEFTEPARLLMTSIQGALLEDDDAFTLTVSGQALGRLGEWELALSAFEAALALQPDYAEAWAYLGEARQQLGRDGGFEALQTARDLDPLSVSVNLFEALYWQRRGNYSRAAIPLMNAAALEPENPYLQIELGQNLVAAGDVPAAVPYFQAAIELSPENPEMWKALAAACIQGEIHLDSLALPAAHWARQLAPDDPEAETILGRVLFLLGHTTNARAHYRGAIRLEPGYAPAHLHLAIALIADRRVDEALGHLTAATELAPGSSEAILAQELLKKYSQ
jgi:tetratricopeptide (TPR) repeat protein